MAIKTHHDIFAQRRRAARRQQLMCSRWVLPVGNSVEAAAVYLFKPAIITRTHLALATIGATLCLASQLV